MGFMPDPAIVAQQQKQAKDKKTREAAALLAAIADTGGKPAFIEFTRIHLSERSESDPNVKNECICKHKEIKRVKHWSTEGEGSYSVYINSNFIKTITEVSLEAKSAPWNGATFRDAHHSVRQFTYGATEDTLTVLLIKTIDGIEYQGLPTDKANEVFGDCEVKPRNKKTKRKIA